MTEEGCLLVMVVDMHPQLVEHDAHTYFNAVMAFANLHLAANVRNSLAVLAANHLESRFLYPSSDGDGVSGTVCSSAAVASEVLCDLRQALLHIGMH